MLLVIDNYDSFVYNLVQYFGKLGEKMEVIRNDQVSLKTIAEMQPDKIVISPGPGIPENAGICLEVIQHFADKIPILGVCLGHQCIGFVYGGKVVRAKEIVHGKTSTINHTGEGIFLGIPQGINVTRYHSLIVKKESIPDDLIVTAWSEDGTVMGIKHRKYPTYGVQFHPESIASQYGLELLQNFLRE
ncbi:MAG: anthranilate synthase component [Clostridia bacterium]|nr:anthranilate synthase component [Clostridia bacterium]